VNTNIGSWLTNIPRCSVSLQKTSEIKITNTSEPYRIKDLDLSFNYNVGTNFQLLNSENGYYGISFIPDDQYPNPDYLQVELTAEISNQIDQESSFFITNSGYTESCYCPVNFKDKNTTSIMQTNIVPCDSRFNHQILQLYIRDILGPNVDIILDNLCMRLIPIWASSDEEGQNYEMQWYNALPKMSLYYQNLFEARPHINEILSEMWEYTGFKNTQQLPVFATLSVNSIGLPSPSSLTLDKNQISIGDNLKVNLEKYTTSVLYDQKLNLNKSDVLAVKWLTYNNNPLLGFNFTIHQ